MNRGELRKNKLTRNHVQTIAASNTRILDAIYNAERVVIILKNISTAGEIISLAFGAEAVANSGIVLNQGDYITFSKDAGYIPNQDTLNAIASVATAKLSIYEEIEV